MIPEDVKNASKQTSDPREVAREIDLFQSDRRLIIQDIFGSRMYITPWSCELNFCFRCSASLTPVESLMGHRVVATTNPPRMGLLRVAYKE